MFQAKVKELQMRLDIYSDVINRHAKNMDALEPLLKTDEDGAISIDYPKLVRKLLRIQLGM